MSLPANGQPLMDNFAGPRRYTISPELVALNPAMGAERDAMQIFADRVITQHIGAAHRGLTICGPSVGVGVSFIAGNLAVALAQAGIATLLVDANLHDPGIDRLFSPHEDGPGLQQLLRTQSSDFREIVHEEVLPNLSIIYAGGRASDASELIAQDEFRMLLGDCLRDYAFTIVDTPAANRSSDALRVSRIIGHSLIIAKRDVSYIEDVETLSAELAQDDVRVIGALFNGA